MARILHYICVVAVILVIVTGSALGNEKEIIVNIPEFTLYLYENGVKIREYPIGIGNVLRPSILGNSRIINRVIDPTYYPPNWWERDLEPIPPGPENPVGTRWLGLDFAGYGIHGTNNPDSVGKAMSAGCIRMYNEDVEELTELITIGTPVSLVYKTVLFDQDYLTGQKLISIHPDIYSFGSNSMDEVQKLLQDRGWRGFAPAVETIVARADGQWLPLPERIQVQLGMDELAALRYGKHTFVYSDHLPITAPQADGLTRNLLGGEYYPFHRLKEIFGLASGQDQYHLQFARAMRDDYYLGQALEYANQWWIEANYLLDDSGVDAKYNQGERVIIFNNTYAVEVVILGERVYVPRWSYIWAYSDSDVHIVGGVN